MELAVVVFYALLLALVAPFVLPKSDFYGRLVPASIALATGSVLWIVFTWLGFSHQEAWIWLIVMLGMPVATWFAVRYLHKTREALEVKELEALRLRGKA
jgi:uncharacterized membrane protein